MPLDPRLKQLLEGWEKLRESGRTPTPEVHCRDCPELLEPFQQLLQQLPLFEPGGTAPYVPAASPGSLAAADLQSVQFRVEGEPLRGGMGEVFPARDRELGRLVALKFVQHGKGGTRAERRFRREVAITARLQHPGIVPVYGTALGDDGRSGYAMRFVQGESFDDAIKRHFAPTAIDESPPARLELLARFEAVCNTMAYAHSRRVIHRDLKPANVMLGTYGETFVVDWGLARSLDDRDKPDAAALETDDPADSQGSSSVEQDTETGAVIGTWAYMPPEQARGDWDEVNERADVFALGGILCKLLTNHPPYSGGNYAASARIGNLTACFDRLDASGADADLIALAKRLLHPDADRRPADAGKVAQAVAAYRTGVEERARVAESERAAAEAQAAEEKKTRREAEARGRAEGRARMAAEAEVKAQRKRRRWQLAAVSLVAVLVGGMGAFAWWQDKQEDDRRAEVKELETQKLLEEARLAGVITSERTEKIRQGKQNVDSGLKLATDLRKQYKFNEAQKAVNGAKDAAEGAPERIGEVEEAQSDLAFAIALDVIRYKKWEFVLSTGQQGQSKFNTGSAPVAYCIAFRERGLDVAALDPAESARRIEAMNLRSEIASEIAAALTDWALYEPDESLRNRLLEVACLADPHPLRDRIRDPKNWSKVEDVERLAADCEQQAAAPEDWVVVSVLMEKRRLGSSKLLRAARVRFPQDFEVAFALGQWHASRSKDVAAGGKNVPAARIKDVNEAIAMFEAARALRPENRTVWNNLAHAYSLLGDNARAIALYKEAIRLNPRYPVPHVGLGIAFYETGDLDSAAETFLVAIGCDETFARAHYNLGNIYYDREQYNDAIREYLQAVRHNPNYAMAYYNLGNAYKRVEKPKEAIKAFRKATECRDGYVDAYINLGTTLEDVGDLDGAIEATAKAVESDPKNKKARQNLDLMVEEYDAKVAKLCRKNARAHQIFQDGYQLAKQGDIEGACAKYQETVKLNPEHVFAHVGLAIQYAKNKDYERAKGHARRAIEVAPAFHLAHGVLGMICRDSGDRPGAHAALNTAAMLKPTEWETLRDQLPPLPDRADAKSLRHDIRTPTAIAPSAFVVSPFP